MPGFICSMMVWAELGQENKQSPKQIKVFFTIAPRLKSLPSSISDYMTIRRSLFYLKISGEVMRAVIQLFLLVFISTVSSFAYANEKYRVEGLAPGEYVVFSSKQYLSYKCTPSDIGDLTWCRKSEKRKFLGQMVDTFTSINHRDDGEVLYISYTITGVKIDDNLASEQIGYLHHIFEEQPKILRVNTKTPSLKNGVIASWGSISLVPLGAADRSKIEQGHATGKGYLIDYLSSHKNSVRERLPVYSISDGLGYIYTLSKSPSGKGTVSFRAVNNSAILAELNKTSEMINGRLSELHDAFAEIEETAANLDKADRLPFDRLYLDFQNDKNITSVKKVEQYNAKLNVIYQKMLSQLHARSQKLELLERLKPAEQTVAAIEEPSLSAELQKDYSEIKLKISELSNAEKISENQVVLVERQLSAFLQNKSAAERLELIKQKNQKNIRALEAGMELLPGLEDQDAANTLLAKAKSMPDEAGYDDYYALEKDFSVFEKKLAEIKEFEDLSENAKFLVSKIELELSDVIDDGETVQSLKNAVLKVKDALISKKLDTLKLSVSALSALYENNKAILKEKTFDTF